MNDYPFVKCLNPRRVLNPYTGESIIVQCNNCPACLMRKGYISSLKIKLESLSHKYQMFGTLTYNNVSLPRMVLRSYNYVVDDCGEVSDVGGPFHLIDITQRLGTHGTSLGRTFKWYDIHSTLSKRTNLPSGVLPHLSKYDVQLFIKRLRKNLDTYFLKKYGKKSPKIRYYLCGEYGPKHYRPHYHFILWFEDDEIYKVIREIVHKSWSFGRIDLQKSLGKCADYVAKYLNSSHTLPEVFECRSVRPFSIHSSHLGEKVLTFPSKEVYSSENDFERIISRCIPDITTNANIFMWRSLKTFYFPKCKGFATKSEQECLFVYSTYEKSSRLLGETNCAKIARELIKDILQFIYHDDFYVDLSIEYIRLLKYFILSSSFNQFNFDGLEFEEHIEFCYSRIYKELLLSKHFHEFVCNNNRNIYTYMFTKIKEFWLKNDMFNLKNQLLSISDNFLIDENFDDTFYYHNIMLLDDLKKSPLFITYSSVQKSRYLNSDKNKKLNDSNNLLKNNY